MRNEVNWVVKISQKTDKQTHKNQKYMTENTTFMETSENNHAPTG